MDHGLVLIRGSHVDGEAVELFLDDLEESMESRRRARGRWARMTGADGPCEPPRTFQEDLEAVPT